MKLINNNQTMVSALINKLGLESSINDTGQFLDIELNPSHQICFVLEGEIELFYHHDMHHHKLTTINSNQIFIHFSFESSKHFIGARTTKKTSWVSCQLSRVFHLVKTDPQSEKILSDLLSQWLTAFMQIPTQFKGQLPDPIRLTFYKTQLIPAKQHALASDEVLWCPINDNDWYFQGVKSILSLNYHGYFPITTQAGIVRATEHPLQPINTANWLKQNSLVKDLNRLQIIVLSVLNQYLQSRYQLTEQMQKDRQTALQSQYVKSLNNLASVLEKERDIPEISQNSPLAGAFQYVLNAMQLYEQSKTLAKLSDPKPTVDRLARHTGLFYRKLSLDRNWHKQNRGPFIGYFGPDTTPCALIPDKGKGYILYDPVNNKRQRLTDKLAQTIHTKAWMLYQGLPNQKLRIRQVFDFAKQGLHRDFSQFFSLVIITSLLGLTTPILTGWLFDPVIPDAMTSQLATIVIGMLFIGVGIGFFSWIQSMLVLRVGGRLDLKAQASIWERVLKLPSALFRRFEVGDFVYRAQGINQMRNNLSSAITQLTSSGLSGICAYILMLYYNWRLALVMLIFVCAYLAIAYSLEKSVLKHAGSIQEARGKLASVNFQLLNMMAKIRATGAERGAFSHWAKRYARYTQVNYNLNRLYNVLAALRSAFDNLGLCLLFIVLGLQGQVLFSFYQQPTELSALASSPLDSVMPTAHFISFNIAYGMFAAAVFGLVNIAIQLLAVKPITRRLTPILETLPERTEGLIVPEHLSGHILINQVSFRYSQQTPWVLSNISLEVKPGEFVAIVGASGSGKSTLIRLLLSFEQPIVGSIYIDRQPLNTLNMLETRRHLGVVLQQSALLPGTIFNNVAADIELTEQAVWEALALAQLDEEVKQMPMQLETRVNENATTLSGGQKQRLMIARALAKKPNILIFDEATSALDNLTQAKINQSLAMQQCTRLVIAHRHSTIMHADTIYVLANGTIVEQGDYKTLLEKKAHFYDLIQKQII